MTQTLAHSRHVALPSSLRPRRPLSVYLTTASTPSDPRYRVASRSPAPTFPQRPAPLIATSSTTSAFRRADFLPPTHSLTPRRYAHHTAAFYHATPQPNAADLLSPTLLWTPPHSSPSFSARLQVAFSPSPSPSTPPLSTPTPAITIYSTHPPFFVAHSTSHPQYLQDSSPPPHAAPKSSHIKLYLHTANSMPPPQLVHAPNNPQGDESASSTRLRLVPTPVQLPLPLPRRKTPAKRQRPSQRLIRQIRRGDRHPLVPTTLKSSRLAPHRRPLHPQPLQDISPRQHSTPAPPHSSDNPQTSKSKPPTRSTTRLDASPHSYAARIPPLPASKPIRRRNARALPRNLSRAAVNFLRGTTPTPSAKPPTEH
ncbi:hypothetical protein R3P38DRAFT_3552419 [Favolaschia claudopus]|uniref:Uncharacterized protein n=1 Tax=Favolaschia claudopus TaxID=2862362 RepID=A0AAW0B289_9AGAR